MEPWGTPTFTRYSCEEFQSRTSWSCLLLRKEEIRQNIWPEIPKQLSLWRRPPCQSLSKAFNISTTTAQLAPDLLKALAILSDTTVRRSAVDWEDLKPHWKSEKKTTFFQVINNSIVYKFLKTILTTKKTNRMVVFSCRLSSNILQYRDHQWNFQQSGK